MAAPAQPASGTGVILLTIFVSMILMLIPLPEQVEFFRPEFVLMVLIYWSMALPNRVGITGAWFTGLFMDVIYGTALGVNALTYALVMFLIARFYLQLRQFPIWQQALIILSLVLLAQLVPSLMAPQNANWYLWLPALTSTLIWPLNYMFLRMVRRSFNVR
jgi:rod shape-determining protein MreD